MVSKKDNKKDESRDEDNSNDASHSRDSPTTGRNSRKSSSE
jgi:hypothetical protein